MSDAYDRMQDAMRRMEEALNDLPSEAHRAFFTALQDYVRSAIDDHKQTYEHKSSSPW